MAATVATDTLRFDVHGPLGSGGMGTVYRAFDRRLGREVALKMLRQVTGRDLYRFKREFRSLADMVHPNLVTLHELHTTGDQWFFTMELVEGVPFLDWVRPGAEVPEHEVGTQDVTQAVPPPQARPRVLGPLDMARLRAALPQLVEGVLALHVGGKLHRDLKPSNVLVTKGGRVVLLDFGLVSDVDTMAAEKTHESAAVGTPAYMSPEQAADDPLSEASDWYSVGVMLYEALTGRRPFEGSSEHLMRRKQVERPVSPREIDPSLPADLDALAMQLLDREASRRPDGRAVLAALGGEPSPALTTLERIAVARPFIGRGAELAALHSAFGDARDHTVAVFVAGESGIGKSQLVRRFFDEIAGQAIVLEGRCYDRESVPYKTLDTVVDALTGVLLGLADGRARAVIPPDIAALARLFPVLRRVPMVAERSIAASLPHSPQELRQRAFGALRTLLDRLTAEAPVVVAIDDLQWGDTDSAVFLTELIHHPERRPLLLVLMHRPEDDAGVVARVRAQPQGLGAGDVRAIPLGPLGDGEARALVQAIGGGDSTSEIVVREAGGHPLFLAELARTSGRRGGPPASLEELIARRIQALPAPAAALLRAAAVAARPVPLELAARAAGLSQVGSEVQLLRAERLVRVRHLGEGTGGDDVEHLETYHDRIRQAALTTLDGEGLRAVHEQLARAYEAGGTVAEREALVAHWMGAGAPVRAAEYAVQAAETAEAALAFHRASALYSVAIAHGVHDAPARRALHRRRGDALANAGHLMEAAAEYAAAARGADEVEALELDRLRLEQLLRHGAAAEGLELSRRLLHSVGVELPDTRKAAIRAVIGQMLRNKLRGLRWTERAEADVPAEVLRRVDLLFATATGLALVDPLLGRIVQCHGLRAALDAGEPRRVCLLLSLELGYAGQNGLHAQKRIDRIAAMVRALAERVDNQYARGISACMQGYVNFEMGRWTDARALLEGGLKTMREHGTGVRWEMNVYDQVLLTTLFYLGEAREAARLAPRLLREAIERGDSYAQDGVRAWRGHTAWLMAGRIDDARAYIDAVVDPDPDAAFQVRHLHELIAYVHLDLYAGDGTAAYQRVLDRWPALDGSGLLRVQVIRVESSLLRGRAALASALEASDAERPVLLSEVRTIAKSLEGEKGWAVPIAHMLRGAACAIAGDRDRAGHELEVAERGFGTSSMHLFAETVRMRRGQLDGGVAGAARVAAARDAMRERGVADVDAIARMLCPWPT